MDITKKCQISGKYGFEPDSNNKFAVIEAEAENGDIIKVNRISGIRYGELVDAIEYPRHEDHPIVDDKNKMIVVGGEQKKIWRTILLIGK